MPNTQELRLKNLLTVVDLKRSNPSHSIRAISKTSDFEHAQVGKMAKVAQLFDLYQELERLIRSGNLSVEQQVLFYLAQDKALDVLKKVSEDVFLTWLQAEHRTEPDAIRFIEDKQVAQNGETSTEQSTDKNHFPTLTKLHDSIVYYMYQSIGTNNHHMAYKTLEVIRAYCKSSLHDQDQLISSLNAICKPEYSNTQQ